MLKEDQYVTNVNTSEHHRPLTTMGSLVVVVSPSKGGGGRGLKGSSSHSDQTI